MNIFKIVLIILGISAVVGIGSVAVKSDILKPHKPVVVNPSTNNDGTKDIPVTPTENTSISSDFGKSVKLSLNGKVSFPDGLIVKLKEINDSRCPVGTQCIWAGEISGNFAISGGKLVSPKDIRLGTTNNKSIKEGNYTFTLKDATVTSITIVVDYKTPVVSMKSCYIGGCSSQICSDQKNVVSTCEYKEEYACYQTAKCERQDNGQCGWTQTSELKACLSANIHL